MKKFLVSLILVTFSSCAGIQPITQKRVVAEKEKVDTTKLYDQEFLQKVNAAKDKYRHGKVDIALKELLAIKPENLKPTEKASRQNLVGVMYFSKKNYEIATKEFEEALNLSKADPYLEAQIALNLGSVYFKNNMPEKSLSTMNQINYKYLQDAEAKKFHQLNAILAEQLGKKDQSISSQIKALVDKKTIEELKQEARYLKLEEQFLILSETEKVRLLESFDEERNLVIPTLVLKEIDIQDKAGNKEKIQDFKTWIEKRYSDNSEVMARLGTHTSKVQYSDNPMNVKLIGVALPLTGDRKTLGERALNGIDIALLEMNLDPNKKFQIEIKDTQSNVAESAFAVSELIEKNNVVAVVGGIVPSSATKEYLEAKKRGVLFISLSPVYLPKEEKDHLLIEIPGSIESQVNQVFSEKILNKFGKRPAIIYPKNELGEAYVNEFWRISKKLNLDVTGIVSFDKNASEFKEPVKNILGIKYTREREEEASIVSDIANLEKNKNIKRLQNLQPQVDFDWIFVPGLPKEVVQVLPNFNYFDAFNLNYIGIPAWRSELMTNEGYRYGNVYFVDENLSPNETPFTQSFVNKFSHAPKIVETISYDAIKIISGIIDSNSTIQTRRDLEAIMSKKESLAGESGSWKLEDGIWMKNLSVSRIRREGVENF
jgi:ABC-type branched-subunit amino acid transport system substrate-binding protein